MNPRSKVIVSISLTCECATRSIPIRDAMPRSAIARELSNGLKRNLGYERRKNPRLDTILKTRKLDRPWGVGWLHLVRWDKGILTPSRLRVYPQPGGICP
jgi:hypothetical protein